MKLRFELDIARVEDEIVAVPLDTTERFNGVIMINETMKDILDLLAEDKTEEELTAAMMQKYKGVSQEELQKSIHTICIDLKNEGLLN